MDDFGRFFDQVFHVFGCPVDIFLGPVFEKVACCSVDRLGAGGDMSLEWVAGFKVRRELRFDFSAADSGSGFVYCHAGW